MTEQATGQGRCGNCPFIGGCGYEPCFRAEHVHAWCHYKRGFHATDDQVKYVRCSCGVVGFRRGLSPVVYTWAQRGEDDGASQAAA